MTRNVQASNVERSEPEGWALPQWDQAAVGRTRSSACEGMQWESIGVELGIPSGGHTL